MSSTSRRYNIVHKEKINYYYPSVLHECLINEANSLNLDNPSQLLTQILTERYIHQGSLQKMPEGKELCQIFQKTPKSSVKQ